MKKILYFTLIGSIASCGTVQEIEISENDIEKIEVFKGYPGEQIQMIDGFESKLIKDLNDSKYNGPTKFGKTHRILIYHSDGAIDTIATNGQLHQYNGCYKSEENLIAKYSR